MIEEISLGTKLVGEIKGHFFIPDYQRGYRWGREEVLRLLDDIYTNGTSNYCLQPLVIKRLSSEAIQMKGLSSDAWAEVVDGQQRLTTIYLIYWYMYTKTNGFLCEEPNFTLCYETRKDSESFLKAIDVTRKDQNVDYWFICSAYEMIQEWFESKENPRTTMINIYKYLNENVSVIWYEVGQHEDAIGLFTRLNIGKIPLTSAELVKALFLKRDSADQMMIEKQEEISLQWDNIERELQDDRFWYFLSNQTKSKYQTRIDLILNLISKKAKDSREQYYTFFYFDRKRHEPGINLDEIWQSIMRTFLTLKDWYENHELYHKIGYLIASEHMTLQGIYDLSQQKTKDQFLSDLDKEICKSIKINENYADLNYEKPTDYQNIRRLLMLFNVESVRKNGEQSQWFPFDKYKYQQGGRVYWSLEHIHAQQSENLRTEEVWKEWLRLHLPSIRLGIKDDALADEMQDCIERQRLEGAEFESIQAKVVQKLSVQGNTEYLHSIANLAMLNTSDNAALNNSTFDVKRNEIIEMDKRGQYIPFCTKMVFLKYYTPSEKNQLHFWGQADRIAYIQAINSVLKEYLTEEIAIEMEE